MKFLGTKNINQDMDEVLQGCVELGAKKRRAKGSEKPECAIKRRRTCKGGKARIQQVAVKSNEKKLVDRKVKVSWVPDEVVQGCVELEAKKRMAKGSEKSECTIKRRRRSSKGEKATTQEQVALKSNEEKLEDRKVKVSNLPVHVLETIFSYLNWSDLGKAMLVCQRWKETGEHPSLWKNFPLQLPGQGWKSYAKIRRLAWVKSLTITLLKEGPEESAEFVQPVIQHFTRAEELFVNCNGEWLTYDHEPNFFCLLWEGTNRLVRIGISAKDDDVDNTTSDHWYFVASQDPQATAFIKKTLEAEAKGAQENISVLGTHWGEVDLSLEVLENICTFSDNDLIPLFRTNLKIDQNSDLSKLQNLLKNHVSHMQWDLGVDSVEDQNVAPLDAILDQLHGQSCNLESGEDHSKFAEFSLPKQLLLKSHYWVGRLGGKEKVDEFGSDKFLINLYHDHESGLRMEEGVDGGQDEDEDEEESSDEEGD